MPGKIKSKKQFRFLEGIAHGMSSSSDMKSGTAKKILSDDDMKNRFKKKKK